MRSDSVIIVIAAFNEEKMISQVVTDVKKYATKVIVVDDCSHDQTAQKAREVGAIVLRHSINLGQGAALQTGFDYAKQFSPAAVVTYDADGQFEAKEITSLVKPVLTDEVDIVLGSRFIGQAKNIPRTRKLILKMGILFTKLFSDLNLTDVHNGFRVLGPRALNLIEIKHNRMAHASEILDQINIHDLKYEELPVTVKYTDYSLNKGQSTWGSIKIISDLILSRFT